MIRLSLVSLALLAAAVSTLSPGRADACSFAGNQEFFVDSDEELLDSQAPGQPTVVSTEIHRFDGDAGCGGQTSCDGIVTLTIEIAVADDRTAAELMGFSLRVVDGELPVDLPATPVFSGFSSNGNASLLFFWDSESAESGTLEITPIDLAGNTGEPIELVISDPGVGGCRVGARRGLGGALLLIVGLALVTRRRKHIR